MKGKQMYIKNVNDMVRRLQALQVADFESIIQVIKTDDLNFLDARKIDEDTYDIDCGNYIYTFSKCYKAEEVPKNYIWISDCMGSSIYLSDSVDCCDPNGEYIGNCDIVCKDHVYYIDTGEHDLSVDNLTVGKLIEILQAYEQASMADGKGSIMDYPIKFINEIENEPMQEHTPHRITNNYMQGGTPNSTKVIDIFFHK